jgi:transcriptional regulator with XRE-family HTH domain
MGGWGQRRTINLGGELARWRGDAGLSLRELANVVHYSYSYLSRIETGKVPLNRKVAEACDAALKTNGGLVAALEDAARDTIRPAQLPLAPPHLVGRKAEIDAMTAATYGRPRGTPAVIVIDGPHGVGKTALALRWAHQVKDQYVDGQLYADLRGFAPPGEAVSADAVLTEFLAAMGAPKIPDTLGQRAKLYRTLLAGRKVLILLDNAADSRDLEPLLPASADCAVVVTSRRVLIGLVGELGATRIAVSPLAEEDSIDLLRQRIGDTRANAEAESVATLARLCAHLPLALRAAADQLIICPHRSVADLVDELAENDQQAGVLEMADLRKVISWSYHTLMPDEARLFRLMGLRVGAHLSVAAVAALAGVTRMKARRLLQALVSVHLVTFESDVLRLPQLTHSYAQELAAAEETAEERTAAAQRLVSWYVATVHEAIRHLAPHSIASLPRTMVVDGVESTIFTNDLDAWTWCDTERDNFGPITTMALQHGPRDAAHQLAAGLNVLGLLSHAYTQGARERVSSDRTSRGTTGQDPPRAQRDDDHPTLMNGFAWASWLAQRGFHNARPWWTRGAHGAGEPPCQLGRSWGHQQATGLVEYALQTLFDDANNSQRPDLAGSIRPCPSALHDDAVIPSPRPQPAVKQDHVPDTAA